MGIGEGTDNWPKDPATGKDLIRFDWRVGKHDDSINTAGLQRVVDRIRLVGPQMGDAAKGILSAILPGQIEKNVRTKYMRMAGEYRKADKKRKRVDEDDDLGDDVEIVDGGLDRAHMNSRVQSVRVFCGNKIVLTGRSIRNLMHARGNADQMNVTGSGKTLNTTQHSF